MLNSVRERIDTPWRSKIIYKSRAFHFTGLKWIPSVPAHCLVSGTLLCQYRLPLSTHSQPYVNFKCCGFFEFAARICQEVYWIDRKCKGKVIPLKGWTGPEGSRRLRLPDFKTIGTWRWKGCQPGRKDYVNEKFQWHHRESKPRPSDL